MTDSPTLGHIGRYELLTRLGAGGMGEVFLARITGTAGFEKQVVIKRMLPHLADNPTFVNRFLDEGRLVVQLRHANIAQVLDMGSDDQTIFIAMEYVEGRDLRELLRLARSTDQPMDPSVAVGLLVPILQALDYAHHMTDSDGRSLDIIHRDVSPANVMVSRTGEVKLVDFGIARAADRLGTSVSGAVQGKYGYMSPQQAAGGTLDARGDQWSVGIMAWESFTGSRPFDGATDLETLDRIRHHDPGSLAEAAPGVPQEIVQAVDRMLQKDPTARFEDAGDAARALQGYLFRTESIVGARELATWFATCLDVLPPDKRGLPGTPLSLNDALRLNLGGRSDSQPAGAPGTVSVATPPPTAGVPGIVPTPTLPPLTAPDRPVSITDINVPQTRGRWLSVLVVLNLTLLIAVAALVMELTTEPEIDTDPTAAETVSAAPPPTPHTPPVTMAAPSPPTPEPKQPSPVVTKPAVTVEPSAPPVATMATLVVQTSPPRAMVRIKGHKPGRAPFTVQVAEGADLLVRASAPGHQTKQVPVVLDGDKTLKVVLPPAQSGSVSFRYFPASATVTVDGKTVSTPGSNRIELSLPVGRHRVEVSAAGEKRVEVFEIKADQATNLATLTVGP